MIQVFRAGGDPDNATLDFGRISNTTGRFSF
jgi:hypothetical protein